MSDGNRSDVTALGRLVFGLVLMAMIVAIGLSIDGQGRLSALREEAEKVAQSQCAETKDCDEKALRLQARELVSTEALLDLTIYQGMLNVFGLLGLGLTVWYAKRAWSESRRSADAAHLALEADQRPWLSLKFSVPGRLTKEELQSGGLAYFTDTDALIKNHGRAPATNVSYHAEIMFLGPGSGSTEDMLRAFMAKVVRRGFDQGVAVFSEQEFPTSHMVAMRQIDIDAIISGMEFKHITPCILGCVNYQSGHTKGIRQTGSLALLSWAGDDGMARVIRPDTPNWWEKPVGLPGTFTMIAT